MKDTDRELLEKAARAAGYEVARWTDDGTALLLVGVEQPWNALHENPHSDCMGDALRLAVKLGIGVLFDLQDEKVTAYEQEPHDRYHIEFADEQNPCAATRRAIVRAAASMGESK